MIVIGGRGEEKDGEFLWQWCSVPLIKHAYLVKSSMVATSIQKLLIWRFII